MQKYRFYLALGIGLFWMLTSILPLPQMFILYFTEGISNQFNLDEDMTKIILYSICVLISCILYFFSDHYWSITLSALGVAIFLTPIFAFYDDVIPQSPFYTPVMLNGIAISLMLLFLNYFNQSAKTNHDFG